MVRRALVPLAVHAALLGAIVILQRLSLPLLVTGTLVNALFIWSAITHHPLWGYALSIVSPLLSVWTAHLNADMVLLVPSIALGNCALLYCYVGPDDIRTVWTRARRGVVLKALVIGAAGAALYAHGDLHETSQRRLVAVVAVQFFTAAVGVAVAESIQVATK